MTSSIRNYNSISTVKHVGASSINASATSVTLAAGEVIDDLPATPFTAVIEPGVLNKEEIVTVTNATGTTLTIIRGEDGSTATSHSPGAEIRHMATGRDFQNARDHIDASTSVHGIADTSALATKAGTETLTNKTINLTNNTLSGSKAQFNSAISDADMATLDGSETLTNKSLTSPTLTGTITNSGTITGGTVSGATVSGGTVAGASLSGTTLATSGTIAFGTNASAITANGATISGTELAYIDGLSSNAQTQINTLNSKFWYNTYPSSVPDYNKGTASNEWDFGTSESGAYTYAHADKISQVEIYLVAGGTGIDSGTDALTIIGPTGSNATITEMIGVGVMKFHGVFYKLSATISDGNPTLYLEKTDSNGYVRLVALTKANLPGGLALQAGDYIKLSYTVNDI